MPRPIRPPTSMALLALLLWPGVNIDAAPVSLILEQNQLSTSDGLSFWTVELDLGSQAPVSGVVSWSQRFDFIGDQLVVQDLGVLLPYQAAAREDLLLRHASAQADLLQKSAQHESSVAELALLQARAPQVEQALTEARAEIAASTVAITTAQRAKQSAKTLADVLAVHKGILEDERSSVQALIADTIEFVGNLLSELLDKVNDLTEQIASVVQQMAEVSAQITRAGNDEQAATETKNQWTSTALDYENELSDLDIEITQKQNEIARLDMEKARMTTLLSVVGQQVQAFPANTAVEGFSLALSSLNGQPLDLPFYGELQFHIDPALPYSHFFNGAFANGNLDVSQYTNITDGTSLISGFTLNLDVPFDLYARQSGPVFDQLSLSLIANNISFLSQLAPGSVPEPQTWALLAAAILLSVGLRHRRKLISS